MYSIFSEFMANAKNKFKMIFTTGRNKREIKCALEDIKNAKINMPLPDEFILEDGLNEAKDIFNDYETYKYNGDRANKLDSPRKAVRQIVNQNSNDLVIVAGDNFNDKDMLNPINYLDDSTLEEIKWLPVYKILKYESIRQKIKELPLISIIAGDGNNLQDILEIKRILDGYGINKIFVANNPKTDFLNRIKHGIYIYGEENSEFKENLNSYLKTII